MPHRLYDDSESPNRPAIRDAFDELALMDVVTEEAAAREARKLPVDPGPSGPELGAEGVDRHDLGLTAPGAADPLEEAPLVEDAATTTLLEEIEDAVDEVRL